MSSSVLSRTDSRPVSARQRESDIAISVQDLAKSYTIQHQEKATSLTNATLNRIRNPIQRMESETFWALNGVSFDVKRGEVIGIIGRNGAGKSTLLKVLSRITEPTRGRAVLHGRVGSLLEVGTGFHPELTGRENVFLNGAVLGMSRQEVVRQFDAIVDFSGTEKFLDTPVKRYSSGMYVRLAFAVAAHLNPEILIVDEVLAVGDSDFQKKCLGKMKDVAHQGRTVLFVSHAMNSVLQLCSRCVYMKNGLVRADGPSREVIDGYITEGITGVYEKTWPLAEAPGTEVARIVSVRTINPAGEATGDFTLSESVIIEMEYAVLEPDNEVMPVFHVFDSQNVCMFSNANADNLPWVEKIYDRGVYRVRATIPRNMFNDGTYNVTPILTLGYNIVIARDEHAIQFELHDDGSGRAGYTGPMAGVLRPEMRWDFEQIAGSESIK